MKNRKIFIKLILIFLLFEYICLFFTSYSQAIDISSLGDLANYGKIVGESEVFMDKAGKVITVVQTVGSIASVVCLIVIGIKYMTGSVEEKAEYKKTLMPYVIGAALVFAASAIAGIVFSFTQGLSGQ